MGTKALTAIVCGVVLLIATAVGAYAWDSSMSGRIAEGVTVDEIDLGGLDERQAAELLREELVEPLEEPVVVTYEGEDFTLRAGELDVHADIDGMVAEAMAKSREGGLPARLVRYATGDAVDHEVEPRVAYSRTAVERFVDGVAAKVNTPPRDATINPTPTSLEPVPGEEGTTLRADELRDGVTAVVEGTGHDRELKAKVDTVQPEVTTKELASQYPTYVTVDRANFKLRLYKDLKLAKEYTVAVGAIGYDTPTGVYPIESKQVDPVWSVPDSDWAGDLAGTTVPGGVPENPLKERWMGIYAGAGIHGTDDIGSLGSAASHGCIRMAVPEVIELYDQVSIGTPVYIR